MEYYRKNGFWYREDGSKLNLEEIAKMLISTREKITNRFLWTIITDDSVRIWDSQNKPVQLLSNINNINKNTMKFKSNLLRIKNRKNKTI